MLKTKPSKDEKVYVILFKDFLFTNFVMITFFVRGMNFYCTKLIFLLQ